MAELARIGVAIDQDLLDKFDQRIARRGYSNRSEAFRDLIRDDLIGEEASDPSKLVVGTLTLVYDHHVRMLSERLTEMQHQHHQSIVSTLHVHLTHDDCLEVLVLRGKSGEVRRIADQLLSTKGVKHGKLAVTVAS
jgi:CopG family nickel-responsive transcriptional regulator